MDIRNNCDYAEVPRYSFFQCPFEHPSRRRAPDPDWLPLDDRFPSLDIEDSNTTSGWFCSKFCLNPCCRISCFYINASHIFERNNKKTIWKFVASHYSRGESDSRWKKEFSFIIVWYGDRALTPILEPEFILINRWTKFKLWQHSWKNVTKGIYSYLNCENWLDNLNMLRFCHSFMSTQRENNLFSFSVIRFIVFSCLEKSKSLTL